MTQCILRYTIFIFLLFMSPVLSINSNSLISQTPCSSSIYYFNGYTPLPFFIDHTDTVTTNTYTLEWKWGMDFGFDDPYPVGNGLIYRFQIDVIRYDNTTPYIIYLQRDVMFDTLPQSLDLDLRNVTDFDINQAIGFVMHLELTNDYETLEEDFTQIYWDIPYQSVTTPIIIPDITIIIIGIVSGGFFIFFFYWFYFACGNDMNMNSTRCRIKRTKVQIPQLKEDKQLQEKILFGDN